MGKVILSVAACLVLMTSAIVVPTNQPASAQDLGARGVSLLQIKGHYTGQPSTCSPEPFCPKAYTLDGEIDVTVGCFFFWCIGSVRAVTRDPSAPEKTVALSALGFGYPQYCGELQGTIVSTALIGLTTWPTAPSVQSGFTDVGVWIAGANAGTMRIAGNTNAGRWEIPATIDLAQVNVRTYPFPGTPFCL